MPRKQEQAESDGRIDSLCGGEKLYEQRARAALPLLVRQAEAGQTVFYSSLAQELGMPNPRNLNYVLGAVGGALLALAKRWGEEQAPPPIQALVVNLGTGMPGPGFEHHPELKKSFASATTRKQKRVLVDALLQDVFAYGSWERVLSELGLAPVETAPIKAKTKNAADWSRGHGRGGPAEGKWHKELKERIAADPRILKLPPTLSRTVAKEYLFPSGDKVDVLFRRRDEWIGVEVKGKESPPEDILRGIYQCVKYQALIEAQQKAEGISPNAHVILAMGGKLPVDLVQIRNLLGIDVWDGLQSD